MSFFQVSRKDGIYTVLMDRAPLNALTMEMLEEGAALLRELAQERDLLALVVSGVGPAFTAGVDTKVAAALHHEERLRLSRSVNSFAAALIAMPCAVVSGVNGHAIGAGGIMCLASDWTLIADAPLKIGLPEAKAGLPFPQVPTIIMEHGLDPVWRRRLALSSMLLGPVEAVKAGLADEVVAPADLMRAALARATQLASQPGFRQIKADQRRKALAEIADVLA